MVVKKILYALLLVFTISLANAQTPVVPNASPEARALLNFLYDVKGKYVLAGQHGIDETEYIYSLTGRYPAIKGFDLIHEPRNVREVDSAIAWWRHGGIPTIMWHWGAPSMGPGYENSKKQIDIDRCFIDGTPENHAMWDDLKRIADWLTKLRDANVPVLWRPMHECDGDWFWYGKGTGAQYCKLWRTMFQYFSEERGLNNLIWVLCHCGQPKADFDPGKDYYDLAGADSYNQERTRKEMYESVTKIHGNQTPIPYHECGTIPDPDLCHKVGADWSWWMLWSGDHCKNHDKQIIKDVYANNRVMTLDRLPRIMDYLNRTEGCKTSTSEMVLLPGDYADPSILKDGDDYYMTHSPFHYQPGFLIWHSKDLLNWQPVCRAGEDWEGSAWAPDLQKVDGVYYIYFPANGTNYVIYSKDIRGPWSKPIDLKISGIDPGLAVTPDGKRYLFTNAGQITPLTPDGLKRDGETRTIYNGWHYPNEWETECMCLESPKITYHNGYYYMTSAQGGTAGPATSHMAVTARARNIEGPWENSPYNPIVHTYSAEEEWWSKGHGTIVEGPDSQWWIVYHAYRKGAYQLGRFTLMEPIEWTQGGWYRPVKDMPLPKTGTLPGLSDNFEGATLGWQWAGWKENALKITQLQKGSLIMPGKGTTPADGRLLTTTAYDTAYTVETEIALDKKGGNAGLVLFYNEKAFAGISGDSKTFTVYKNAMESEKSPNKFGRNFKLRIENRNGIITIVATDGLQSVKLAENLNIKDFHHNKFGEFIALRPCIFSGNGGSPQFKSFTYNPIMN